MIDSPITLLLLFASIVSGYASYRGYRRWNRERLDASALANLTDADLLAALTSLQPQATSAPTGAQRPTQHSISVTHSASGMRDAHHPVSASWAEHDREVRRRITLLVVEEIERRGLSPAWFK